MSNCPNADDEICWLFQKYSPHLGPPPARGDENSEAERMKVIWSAFPSFLTFFHTGRGWTGSPRAADYSNNNFKNKRWKFAAAPYRYGGAFLVEPIFDRSNERDKICYYRATLNPPLPCANGYFDMLRFLADENRRLREANAMWSARYAS